MILKELARLYDRLKDDRDYDLPVEGYSVQNITFRIVLNSDGSLHEIQDARESVTEITKSGKSRTKVRPRRMLVPGNSKPPGSGINPCYLWDNSAYLLGYKKPDNDPVKASKEAARAIESFAATREHYIALASQVPALGALRAFYENHWTPERAAEWRDGLDDFAATGFGVFRILPDRQDVHERDEVRSWWRTHDQSDPSDPFGTCLVTGEEGVIARVQDPPIKGVNGAAPGGAKLASFEKHSFRSYTKDQAFNSPVSTTAVFAYCNALNALLSGPLSHRHRVVVGDVTIVLWTERKTAAESLFAHLFSDSIPDPAAQSTGADLFLQDKLKAFLSILRRGGGAQVSEIGDDPDTRFFILGLSGNVTRLVVRFWHVSTIAAMLERLRAHYAALALNRRVNAHPYHEPEFPSAQRLLDQTARERKAVSPLLGGQLMQAILHGTRYPMTLYQGVLGRLRANDEVTYLKAAILKAILIRNFNRSIDMSLNIERTEPGYLLGRLFAALEKSQEDALGKVNAGLRERFYSSASATPGTVFPRILRTYQHHLAKLDPGVRTNREKLVQSIHAPLDGYPSHLSLEEQGLFAVGYYHQRQAFFTKKESGPDGNDSETTTSEQA